MPRSTKPANPADLLTPEELSKSIKQLARATRKLLRQGHLHRRAIVLLIHDALPSKSNPPGRTTSGRIVSKRTVSAILDTIEQLEDLYCG